MSGFDQNSIAVPMPTVTGTAAALGGPFKIKPSEAFSGALMTVSGLTGENISVQTSPDGYWGAPASPTFYRTDWQGTQQLYPTSRENLLFNSLLGGGAIPTSWTQPTATGTSTPVVSAIGGPGVAFLQTATAERPYFSINVTLLANTTYCFSMIVESVSGGLTASDVLRFGAALPSGTMTWPSSQANPSGASNVAIGTGVLIGVLAIGVTGGVTFLRCGIGPNNVATGSLQFSHPQLELGSSRTGFIGTPPAATASITDYALSNGVITVSPPPLAGATLSYDNGVLPSPYFIFATGNGTRTAFAYDGVWGTLTANSAKGNGIHQIDLRGAQAYQLVKSGGAETATVNMTLKRDALQYKNTAGTWSVT